MSERWSRLSEWHNAWLAADPDQRRRMIEQAGADLSELAPDAVDLAARSEQVGSFLETPAFVLAAQDLASHETVLAPGAAVGPYVLAELMARGGMSDVYRATDPRLGREVAVKVLSTVLLADPSQLDRFLQEARVTASLDHPNIVRIHDVGVVSGRPYMVAELLDGETLRTRLGHGPLTIDEAIRVAEAAGRGLHAAHGAGLVHRDVKPENILVTRAGITKILDFGVAKLTAGDVGQQGLVTLPGVVFGTAGYAAPEQIAGDPVDRRADLFALGAVLFEMLTGRRPFERSHTVSTLHAILHDPTPDVREGRPDVPPTLAAIVGRLLEKSPEQRFQSAADLVWALEQIDTSPIGARPRPEPGDRLAAPVRDASTKPVARRLAWPMLLLAACGLTVVSWWLLREASPAIEPVGLTRFTWTLPEGLFLDSAPVLSPDSRRLVFAGRDSSGASRLFIRNLAEDHAVAIAGTEGARQPFWSPDSRLVGFFARAKLMKVMASGGAPTIVADAPDARGGAWSSDGTILFQPRVIQTGLSRVSADGGPVEAATSLVVAAGDTSHHWPHFLPDGRSFFFFVRSIDDARRGAYVGHVDRSPGPVTGPLVATESTAVFAPLPGASVGALFYTAASRLEVRRFDPARLAFVGEARAVADRVAGHTPYHEALVSVSADALAYASSPPPFGQQLLATPRSGSDARPVGGFEIQNWPRVSPDGTRVARVRTDPVRGNPDIWVDDLERGTQSRVTTSRDIDGMAAWSPDSRRLAFSTGPLTSRAIAVAAVDGSGVLATLPCPTLVCDVTDWSPDGSRLLLNARRTLGNLRDMTGSEIWTIAPDGRSAAIRLFPGPYGVWDARQSPDGNLIAYVSAESGRAQVSIRWLTGAPRQLVVSREGGDAPVWSRDGKALYFVDPQGQLKVVAIGRLRDDTIQLGLPDEVKVPPIGFGHFGTQYDVGPGGRIYSFQRNEAPGPREVRIVLGWRAPLGTE